MSTTSPREESEMTTNIERAEEIMSEWAEVKRFAPEIAQQMANANPPVIMPDLPEPETVNGQTVWRVDEEGFVYIKSNGWITTLGVETPYESPDIAHRHALAIIAAANHKQEQA